MSEAPYKFLDYYEKKDQDIFFGRKREIRILLADIIISRLVILFAQTGTGKTSLINAGVRPSLEERGYRTLFIRTGQDPVESLRAAFSEEYQQLKDVRGNSILRIIRRSSKLLRESEGPEAEKPVVVFFDQFEEFFLYLSKRDVRKGQQFISDVAVLHRRKETGVHFVFSLREDFLAEMDAFRDKIPIIFHSDSNLRLRWFEEPQARAAIEEPARVCQVIIEPDVVDELIRDLSNPAEGGLIEPAQLQIVCDTLWQHRLNGRITLDQYRQLDSGLKGTVSIARQVLLQRLEEQFDKIEDKQQLDLLARLLPELSTQKKTKRLWELDTLAKSLDADTDLLTNLVQHLERSALVRTTQRGNQLFLALAHDYLVDGLDEIAKRVRSILPRRLLNLAWQKYSLERTLASTSDLEEIAPYAHALTLTSEQCEFLFLSAVRHGNTLRLWFDLANKSGVDVWRLIERIVLEGADKVSAYSVVHLLGELQTEPAMDLLQRTMRHENEELASSGIETLGGIQTRQAVESIEAASRRGKWLPQIRVALARLSHAPERALAEYAQRVLKGLSESTRETSFATDSIISIPTGVIQSMLIAGRLIPFLGSQAAYTTRRHGETWTRGETQFMPTQEELAKYLAKHSGFRIGETFGRGALAIVASYFSLISNQDALYEVLHEIYTHEFLIPPLYQYLAELTDSRLIVTNNYDRTLERAFDEARRPYDIVVNSLNRRNLGNVLVWRSGDNKPYEVHSKELDKVIDLQSRTVIYKMNGSIFPSVPRQDSYLITEIDLTDIIARLNVSPHIVPPILIEYISSRSALFLGYELNNWFERQLALWVSRFAIEPIRGAMDFGDIGDMTSEIRSTRSSWAIDFRPTQLAAQLWNAQGVKSYDLDSLEFIRQLRESL